jgi:hypothetical protein
MPFPSILSTFSQTNTTSKLNSPSHSGLHNTISSTLGQVEAVIGTDALVLGTIIGDLRSTGSAGGGHVQTAVKGGTGQTTFTKGDILVAQSSSVLSKLAIGTDGSYLMVDSTQSSGIIWGSVSNLITVSLTSANILAMTATPVQVIAAPGAGKVIIVENVLSSFTYIADAYEDGTNVVLEEETSGTNVTGTICSLTIMRGTANAIGVGYPVTDTYTAVANKAIMVTTSGAAFATGTGTLKLYIKYRVVTL